MNKDKYSNTPSFWHFSIKRKNKAFIKEVIKKLTSIDINYKFNRIETIFVFLSIGFIIIPFVFSFFGFRYIEKNNLVLISLLMFCLATIELIIFYSYLLSGYIKIDFREKSKSDENFIIDMILILYNLKKMESKAIKKRDKQFHLLLSLGNYSNYADTEIQKNFAYLVYDFILRNDNLSIIINNSHPVFLATMLSNYQKGIADAENGEYPLKNQFTMIQSYKDSSLKKYFEEDFDDDELGDDEDDSYLFKSVRFIDFPDTGDLPLSFMPISSEEYAVERRADKLSKTKLDITKSLATELSHEIRNPIGVIQLIAENILSGKIENLEEQKIYLRDILKQTDRIDEVLKYFSSIETNRKSGSKELSINKIILDAFNFFQEQLESNSVHVEYQLDQGLPKIHGVSESLGNVLVNLIRNSIYALNGKENKKILVRTFMESDSIKIEVTDNGCGIDSNHRPKIFSPFFTTKSSGSGIGLWLSHRTITEEFSGKFTFTSEENKGTTFFIALPIERENT